MKRKTSRQTVAASANDLRDFLVENGPSTKGEIMSWLGWGHNKISEVFASQPEWLVVCELRRVGGSATPLYAVNKKHVLGCCKNCGRRNFHPSLVNNHLCYKCNSKTKKVDEYYTEEELQAIDPHTPCDKSPGTEDKVMLMAKRYAAGVPLWNASDKPDHESDVPQMEESEDDWDWYED